MKKVGLIYGSIYVLVFCTLSGFADLLINDSFETDPIGFSPVDWGVSQPGSNTVLISDTTGANGSSQSIQLTTLKPNSPATSRSFSTVNSGTLHIEWYSRVEQLNADSQYIQIRTSSSAILLGVRFDNTANTFAYKQSDASWQDLPTPYTSQTWYKLRIDIDFDADHWDLSIDGAMALNDGAFVSGISAEASSLLVQGQANLGDGVSYFDELTIQTVPEPSSLLLTGIAGAYVTWFRRRNRKFGD